MKTSTALRLSMSAFWIIASLAALVFVLWIGSYFSGTKYYQSRWSQSDSESQENACWMFSNGGALILSRRTQSVIPKMESVPGPETKLSSMTNNDRVSLGAGRTTNLAFWHWFRFSSESTPMGASSTTYSQLIIPWWSLFLLLLIVASAVYRSVPQADPDPS